MGVMRTLDTYTPTRFMAAGSTYDKRKADFAVAFIQALKHTKGRWSGSPSSSSTGRNGSSGTCSAP